MCVRTRVSSQSFSAPCRLSASPEEHNTGWKFYFKLYCFLDTHSVPKDSVEFAFMFEQVNMLRADACVLLNPTPRSDKSYRTGYDSVG